MCITFAHFFLTTARPKESQLLFHVATRLGQDWRRVCTCLGLYHRQLDQADVMWLKGHGDFWAPHSWENLLQALRQTGQWDMASELEEEIRSGRLLKVNKVVTKVKNASHVLLFIYMQHVHELCCLQSVVFHLCERLNHSQR